MPGHLDGLKLWLVGWKEEHMNFIIFTILTIDLGLVDRGVVQEQGKGSFNFLPEILEEI